jgi:hypothetical protein
VNSPWWLGFLWTILSPFMSAATKAKIKWIYGNKEKLHEQLSPYVADEELETGTPIMFRVKGSCYFTINGERFRERKG